MGTTNILECAVTLGTAKVTDGEVKWEAPAGLGSFSNNVDTVTLDAQGKARTAWIATAPGTGEIKATGQNLKDPADHTTALANVTTNITVQVVNVDSVEFETFDDNTPLDGNDGGVGKRIFPDKKTFDDADAPKRKKVKVKARITPAIAGISVYFKSFDVDDATPIAIDPDSVIDGNGLNGDDNNGSPKPGSLSAQSATTGTNGVATVELTVTMQPGNNFRVAAACRSEDLTPLVVDDSSPNFYVPGNNNQVSRFAGKLSDMLTVWRRLWLEFDSMGPPPASFSQLRIGEEINHDEGVITQVKEVKKKKKDGPVPAQTLLTVFVLHRPPNLIGRLSDDENRFENGRIDIQGIGSFTVVHSSNFKDYSEVLVNGAVGKEARNKDLKIYDDDVVTVRNRAPYQLPYELSGGTLITSAFADSYILPVKLPSSFVQKDVLFKRNLVLGPFGLGSWFDAVHEKLTPPDTTEDFWKATCVAAWQGPVSTDADPDSDDPIVFGQSDPSLLFPENLSAIYIETIRESEAFVPQPRIQEEHVVVHEIGHQGGGEHEDGGIMAEGAPIDENSFKDKTIKRFRLNPKY